MEHPVYFSIFNFMQKIKANHTYELDIFLKNLTFEVRWEKLNISKSKKDTFFIPRLDIERLLFSIINISALFKQFHNKAFEISKLWITACIIILNAWLSKNH